MNAVTQPQSFCLTEGKPLFTVNPGVPVAEALEQASVLLAGISHLVINDPLNDDERNSAHYLLQMADALVKASVNGLWEARKAA